MTTVRFEVDIVGPKPDEVPATDLCEFVTEFVRAVAEAGANNAAEPAEADRAEETPVAPCVSLVEISEGSDRLTFATTREYAQAVARIASSIRRGRYAALPRSVHESLHRMSQVTYRRGWGIRFPANRKLGIVTATLKKGADIPAPKPLPAMTGSTTLLGRLMRVGGVSPKAELRLPNRPDLLYVDVTEEMAMALAGRLYQDVSLEGTASWDPDTWRLRSFRVARLLDFAAISPAAAFRELAASAGDAWNGVDALAYVRSSREGGDGDLH
jgi:hypothetical protein